MSKLSEYRILVDKVRAGYDQEDAVGKTPISEASYNLLGSWFKRLIDAETTVSIGPDMFLQMTGAGNKLTGEEKAAASRGERKGVVTHCFLNWCSPDWGMGERRLFVSLVCAGGLYFLNQDYNPAKLLTGQNAFGPRPQTTWMGKRVEHTPAGYVELGYNLLGYFLAQATPQIGPKLNLREHVDPSTTMWSRMDLVDLVDMGSTEDRDRMLRVLNNAAKLSILTTKHGVQRELNLRYLFGLEALPVMAGRVSKAPTLTLKRWLAGNDTNGRNGKAAYTLNLYAKDVEMADTGKEERFAQYKPAYRTALQEGIRIEIQLTPDALKIPEVRKYCTQQGWLPGGEGRPQNVHSTLKVMFPTYETYLERSCLLARFLWQESCFALVMAPPEIQEMQDWAKGAGEVAVSVINAWVGDVESPNDVPLPRAQVFQRENKKVGSRAEVEGVYSAFEAKWKFKLNRVPAVAFPLLTQQLAYGLADDDTQTKLAVIHTHLLRNERLRIEAEMVGDDSLLEDMHLANKELVSKHNKILRHNVQASAKQLHEFRRLVRKLKPNSLDQLRIQGTP